MTAAALDLDTIRDVTARAIIAAVMDGTTTKLQSVAPHRDRWTTRITSGAYERGFMFALRDRGAIAENPYTARSSTYLSGRNDPSHAWRDGFDDGQRARRIINRPESVPDLMWREYKALPADLRARVDGAQ